MMDHHVLTHEHDTDAGVYRVVIGIPIYDEATRDIVDYHDVENIVFDADDKRWNGKSKHKIAEAQREIVRNALIERQHEALKLEEERNDPTPLPGAGGEL